MTHRKKYHFSTPDSAQDSNLIISKGDLARPSGQTHRIARQAIINACDCHIHVYDERFPWAPNASLKHPSSTVAMYRHVQRRLGLSRLVVVSPSAYGTDNRCMVNALAEFGSAARGICVVDSNVDDETLLRLDRAGVRGIRFNLIIGAANSISMIRPLAERIQRLGWHVQLNMRNDDVLEHRGMLRNLPVPIVFDHFARIPPAQGLSHPVGDFVSELMASGRAYVKLSAAYLASNARDPALRDVGNLARALIAAAQGRVIWGSDWPHPTQLVKPDTASLLELLYEWTDSPEQLESVLSKNPEALYDFG